jgi:2-keto-4-pentenoate hydratase
MADAREIARRLLDAYETGVPIEPVRSQVAGIAAAYEVQRASVDVWERRGRKLAGRKIGLTAKAVQAQLGVDEPDFGALFADMILDDGATIARGKALQPRIEAEIAFVLKSDLSGEHITPEAVIAATEYVVPAIEVCGSRIARWDIRIEDTIADNASGAFVVLGKSRRKPVLAALAAVPMTLRQNDAVVGEGQGSACLGNPAIAVAWLAEALTRFGEGLRAGDLVMSGALSKMITAEQSDRFVADFAEMGTVSVRFGA